MNNPESVHVDDLNRHLEFPIAPAFGSQPGPRVGLQAMLRRIAENITWRNKRPGAQERRLAEKISDEFVL
jgi:hypothetical protein